MESKIIFIKAKTSPLCITQDGRLICYSNGKIQIMRHGIPVKTISISQSRKEYLFGRNRLLSRLFRIGIRAAFPLDNRYVLLARGCKVCELDMERGTCSEGWVIGDGIRPLQFSEVKDIDGIEDGIYFGGYLHNYEMQPVSIYRRKGKDNWEIVYTFPKGEINHVHNIVADPYRQCLWIFTGDFDDAAAIWKVTDKFRQVERIAYGDQCWRSCVAFVLEDGLMYATDTPRTDNYLFLLKPDTMEQLKLIPLHGSCIYGCQWNDKYVLSSSVESDGGKMSLKEKWFGQERGKGIKDAFVHLYCGNPKESFHEIYKEEKDWLPFTLFQFGSFRFPAGVNTTDTLYFQPIATQRCDLSLLGFIQ